MSTTRWYLRDILPTAPPGSAYPATKKASNAGTTGLGTVGTRSMTVAAGSASTTSAGNATGNIYCNTWLGPALAPQTISGELTITIGEVRGVAGAVDIMAFVYLWRPSGAGAVVGELYGDGAGGFDMIGAFGGAADGNPYNRLMTLTLDEVACEEGDIICLELWQVKASSNTSSFQFNGPMAYEVDGATIGTGASSNAAYAEFDSTIYLQGEEVPPDEWTGRGLPPNFYTALATRHVQVYRWLEVAGLPWAYGNFEQAAAWYARRAPTERFLGIKPYFEDVPAGVEATLDPLEAVAESMGELAFNIVDADGEPTKWAGVSARAQWVYLNSDRDATDTTFPYRGDGSAFGSSGTAYVGGETITYTGHNTGFKTLTGVSRGMYRSTAQAWGAGTPVAPSPYTMRGRNCWHYYVAVAKGGTLWDENRALRFSGTVEGFRQKNLGTYTLTAQSLEKALDRKIFRDLQTYRDTEQVGISGPPWGADEPGIRNETDPGFTDGAVRGPDVENFDDGQHFIARVDDELIYFYRLGGGVVLGQRGKFNTTMEKHDRGFTAKEVAWVAQHITSGTSHRWEHLYTKFNSTPTVESPLPASHPLIVILQVLLSTGAGTNFISGKRNYDVLPESWSIGIPIARVDVEGIESAAQEWPELQISGIFDREMAFLEFAKAILKPFGFYAFTMMGGLWTIRRLRPPLPDEASTVIDHSTRISKSPTDWDANVSAVVQEIVFNYDLNVVTGNYGSVSENIFADATLYTGGQGRRLVYECPFIYSPGANIPGKAPLGALPNPEAVFRERSDHFRSFTRPAAVISERVDYSKMFIEPGDVVAVTHPHLPNPETAGRGVVGALCQVLSRSIDDQAKVVELELLNTGYETSDYRYLAPSLEVESVTNTTTFVYAANAFSLPWVRGNEQDDNQLRGPNDAVVQPFTAGETVRIATANFVTLSTVTINSVNTTTRTIVLSGAPATALAVGQFVILPAFDSATSGDKALYSWLADSTETLGASDENPSTYFP